MPPKSKKKKGTVKIVSGTTEEAMGRAIVKKLGRETEGSEYCSEYQETPRSE
jgi:hypothetical protein